MDTDPIDALNQNLKAAGIHPSQIDPVVLHEHGDIFPHIKLPEPLVHFVRGKPDPDVDILKAEIRALRIAAGLPPEIRSASMVLHLPD
jgi:hypothetical protein